MRVVTQVPDRDVPFLDRGDPAEILARIDAEARIFGARLGSEEFRAAVRAVLGRARGTS